MDGFTAGAFITGMAVGYISRAAYGKERNRFLSSLDAFRLLSQTEGVGKLQGAFWKRTALLYLFGSVASLAGSFIHPAALPVGLTATALLSPTASRLWLLGEMKGKEARLRDALTSYPPLLGP